MNRLDTWIDTSYLNFNSVWNRARFALTIPFVFVAAIPIWLVWAIICILFFIFWMVFISIPYWICTGKNGFNRYEEFVVNHDWLKVNMQ
jgi:hypothetical protein